MEKNLEGRVNQVEIIDKTQEEQFDEVEVKKILRKIDFRLLPVLTTLYLLSFLDRGNIGNANVAGLSKDLGLSSTQYNICLTVFFFPYALFEVPSNIVLKILRPRIWLTTIVISWGAVMTCMSIVKNYQGLILCRFFLGVTEAGLFPAATYIMTTWYCRYELQTRLSVFYCAASIAGAFSGLLAFAIQQMEGVGGLHGWQWIFMLEGALTVVFGFTLPFTLLDSPEKSKLLTPEQREMHLRRLKLDYSNGVAEKEGPFEWKYLIAAVKDWKIYLSVIIFWGNTITGYGFAFTLPTAIKGLGYTNAQAQLMTIPIYVVALIVVLICSYYADKVKQRAPFIIYTYALCAVGFVALMALPKDKWPGARYGVLFVVATGLYPSLVTVISWNANNLAGTWKRSIGVAFQITMGNLGGAVGSNIYLATEAPYYWTGYGVSFAVLISAILAAIALRWGLARINKQRDQMSKEDIYATYTVAQLQEMGDRSPLFRYTL